MMDGRFIPLKPKQKPRSKRDWKAWRGAALAAFVVILGFAFAASIAALFSGAGTEIAIAFFIQTVAVLSLVAITFFVAMLILSYATDD